VDNARRGLFKIAEDTTRRTIIREHEPADGHGSPLPNTALEGPELPCGEHTGVRLAKAIEGFLGVRVRLRFEPLNDLWPHCLVGVLPGQPVSLALRLWPVTSPSFQADPREARNHSRSAFLCGGAWSAAPAARLARCRCIVLISSSSRNGSSDARTARSLPFEDSSTCSEDKSRAAGVAGGL
jgi:hypothetical protein